MTSSNIAFFMAMTAKMATEEQLFDLLVQAISEYRNATKARMSKEHLQERRAHVNFMMGLITLKFEDMDPTECANKVEQVEKFTKIFDPKQNQ